MYRCVTRPQLCAYSSPAQQVLTEITWQDEGARADSKARRLAYAACTSHTLHCRPFCRLACASTGSHVCF